MRKVLFRRPSPAMLVAMTALVASFAGPAVADEVARIAQSIGGSQVRNNSLTGADVRNNTLSGVDIRNGGLGGEDIGTAEIETADLANDAVRGDKVQPETLNGTDIADDGLGGEEIDESTLGPVPRTDQVIRVDRRISVNQRINLFTHGSVGAEGRCVDNGGTIESQILAETSQPGAVFMGDQLQGVLNPDTAEDDRKFENPSATGAADPPLSDGFDDAFTIAAENGPIVTGAISSRILPGTGECRFFGHVVVTS